MLIVDDDVAIGGTIRRYLRLYTIELADCVEGALAKLASQPFDLVLLDRRLPDGLGDLVLAEIRQRWRMPVIMMSGEIDVRRFYQNGADDFIEKPFVREALVDKIERLLASDVLRRQAAQQQAELAALHARRDHEVDVAGAILARMFARGDYDPARVRRLLLPFDRLAGDVVFGVDTGPDTYRWMIGDVTGHTLSSALVTLPLAGMFFAFQHLPLVEVLARFEAELVAMLPANMFCVAAICELDRRAGTLQVWNGGSPDVLLRHQGGGVTRISSTGPPIGAERFAAPAHAISHLAVEPGDRIYAFSDGLTEVRDVATPARMIGFD
ncbi:MAG: SpoIIE family protein phosphatase, partial [Proteobacteria bacterium]|nr:SpoIIE family protein phosphatase [Pseudomonadota bacterium]